MDRASSHFRRLIGHDLAGRSPVRVTIGAMLALLALPLASPAAAGPSMVSAVTPVAYVSQLSEPAPTWWRWVGTPYCAAAASLMVMSAFGVPTPAQPLATTFAIGRAANTSEDLGIDPDGIAHLMRTYGGSGGVHIYSDQATALDHLIGRLNHGAPVVVLSKSGWHTVVAYGYEAVAGGPVTAIYAADPLSGHNGKVAIDRWLGDPEWWGGRFTAPGEKWRGAWVFVTYHDFRAAPVTSTTAAVAAPAIAAAPVHASQYLASGLPDPVLAVGGVADVQIFVRNTGQVAWIRGTATEARLGVKNDDTSFHATGGAVEWPYPSRPAIQSQATVAPGTVATFMFRVRGGAPGAYLLSLRPVIDGVTWLNDDGIRVVVTVR
jgi:hypothetical protein